MDLVYDSLSVNMLSGTVALGRDPLRVMLVTSDYVFNPQHKYRSDITGEAMGQGYESGGKLLENIAVHRVGRMGVLTADTVTWEKSTVTATGAVIYRMRGDPSNEELVGYHRFEQELSSSRGPFELQWKDGVIVLGEV